VTAVASTISVKRARAARWLHGKGAEIGALHNPLAVGPDAHVTYVDRLPVEALKEHYPELSDVDLVRVDVMGDAQDLSEFASNSLDFVIANHLLEHLEDPIRGLAEMMRVLKRGGMLYLALPDARATFDATRALTTVDHVIDEYRNGTHANREAHFLDWVEHAEKYRETADKSRLARARELMAQDYSIHYHVWRPDTFLEVLIAAKHEAGLEFEVADFLPCYGNDDIEFIYVLAKGIAERPALAPPVSDNGDGVNVAVERELARVLNSRSWQVTRPLRWASRQGRRVRGKLSKH